MKFRPYWACWLGISLAVVLLGVSVFAAVRLQGSDTGSGFAVSDQVAMGGLGLVLALAALLPLRLMVRADAEGVVVRNAFFSRRFDWQEIGAVNFPDGALFPRLELPADEYYTVQAVQAVDRHRAVDAVRMLRRLHRAALRRVAAASETDAVDESAVTGDSARDDLAPDDPAPDDTAPDDTAGRTEVGSQPDTESQ